MSKIGENERIMAECAEIYHATNIACKLHDPYPQNMTKEEEKIYRTTRDAETLLTTKHDTPFFFPPKWKMYAALNHENEYHPFYLYEKHGVFYHYDPDAFKKQSWYTYEVDGQVMDEDTNLSILCLRVKKSKRNEGEIVC